MRETKKVTLPGGEVKEYYQRFSELEMTAVYNLQQAQEWVVALTENGEQGKEIISSTVKEHLNPIIAINPISDGKEYRESVGEDGDKLLEFDTALKSIIVNATGEEGEFMSIKQSDVISAIATIAKFGLALSRGNMCRDHVKIVQEMLNTIQTMKHYPLAPYADTLLYFKDEKPVDKKDRTICEIVESAQLKGVGRGSYDIKYEYRPFGDSIAYEEDGTITKSKSAVSTDFRTRDKKLLY